MWVAKYSTTKPEWELRDFEAEAERKKRMAEFKAEEKAAKSAKAAFIVN